MERLEASCHRDKRRDGSEHTVALPSKEDSGTIDSCKIIGIEFSGEHSLHLYTVEAQECAIETLLHYATGEISLRTQRIRVTRSLGVLQHHLTHLVVGVSESESRGRQIVEK